MAFRDENEALRARLAELEKKVEELDEQLEVAKKKSPDKLKVRVAELESALIDARADAKRARAADAAGEAYVALFQKNANAFSIKMGLAMLAWGGLILGLVALDGPMLLALMLFPLIAALGYFGLTCPKCHAVVPFDVRRRIKTRCQKCGVRLWRDQ